MSSSLPRWFLVFFAHASRKVEGHVPLYDGSACVDSCCAASHAHTTSQAIYLKGSGGLEVHYSASGPFDLAGGESLDVDFVTREAYDVSTFALYVGCGGCLPDDPIVAPRLPLSSSPSALLEPFTQTAYFRPLLASDRVFNSSLLSTTLCDQEHFTIRVVDFANRSDGQPLIWSAVLGLDEAFTFGEILSFPSYILSNHGAAWNQLGYVFWCALVAASSVCMLLLSALDEKWRLAEGSTLGDELRAVRALLYWSAIVVYVSVLVDELVNLAYAQSVVGRVGGEFWTSLFLVVLLPQGLPLSAAISLLVCVRCESKLSLIVGGSVEVCLGLLSLALFGSGFYVGPILFAVAGILRVVAPAPK